MCFCSFMPTKQVEHILFIDQDPLTYVTWCGVTDMWAHQTWGIYGIYPTSGGPSCQRPQLKVMYELTISNNMPFITIFLQRKWEDWLKPKKNAWYIIYVILDRLYLAWSKSDLDLWGKMHSVHEDTTHNIRFANIKLLHSAHTEILGMHGLSKHITSTIKNILYVI
jgi:hypothetical protein